MRPRWVIALIAIGTVVGWFLFTAPADKLTQQEMDSLLRRESARSTGPIVTEPEDAEPDWEQLAAENRGQPVPSSLTVHPDPSGDFWFVGKQGRDVAVEVPFTPGRFPTPPPSTPAVSENPGFLGAQACQECHQQRYDGFIHTAHHRTSRVANLETISGSFEDPHRRLKTRYPDVSFTMVARGQRCFQHVSFLDWEFEVPFDLIIGSSKMAETYLYWHSDQLFQMNVTYLSSLDRWINSPGYIDGDAAFARPIPARCLDCHLTYADYRGKRNHYTPDSLILGISCERCHGPGQSHVQFHQSHPTEKVAKFVTVPSNLSRQQQLDICGQCHSTVTPLKGAPFQFRPGDVLSDHYEEPDSNNEGVSVHTSNQLARLALSKCFSESEMACIECHNPHKLERGDMRLFSARCMKCHEEQSCGMPPHAGLDLASNCIDCHMPKTATENLRLSTSQGDVFPPLRDHHVRVSGTATQRYLDSLDHARDSDE